MLPAWRARSRCSAESSALPRCTRSVYGEIGSSLYYALGITAVYALGLTPIVFLIAGALFTLAAAAYAEGGATIDEPGGGAAFARRAFNDMVGLHRRAGRRSSTT